MNRKGIMVVEAVFAGLFFLAFVAAMFTRPQHVEKRYLEKCTAEGKAIETCQAEITPLSLDERIDYIRDKATGPTTYNFTHK